VVSVLRERQRVEETGVRPHLLLLPLLWVGVSGAATTKLPSEPHTAPVATQPPPIERGTEEYPAVVEVAPSTILRVEAVDKTARPIDYHSPEWVLAGFTGVLATVTAALALYTFRLYRATVGLGRDAKTSAEQQSQRMERSIAEAGRAATARASELD
jgi:hypothetical protein